MEWRTAALQQQENDEIEEWPELATMEERDFFFQRFEAMLDEKGFFATQEMAPIVKRNAIFFHKSRPNKARNPHMAGYSYKARSWLSSQVAV